MELGAKQDVSIPPPPEPTVLWVGDGRPEPMLGQNVLLLFPYFMLHILVGGVWADVQWGS